MTILISEKIHIIYTLTNTEIVSDEVHNISKVFFKETVFLQSVLLPVVTQYLQNRMVWY